MSTYIGLLDCNNFFVSCERLFRPDLQNVPTVVLSSNDGCVVARSKEVKELGIPMGVPYFKVRDELRQHKAVVFSSNFPLYRDISHRVMTVLKSEIGVVEQYSVDEAFFAIEADDVEVPKILTELKKAVERQVGVPISIGAAKTKTIAKYASEVGKKGSGTAFIHGEEWNKATHTIPVHEIWGIGRKTSVKMHQLGINTVAALLESDRARIDTLFGIGGLRMHDELSEKQVYRLGSRHSTQSSIMSTRSFKTETTNPSVVSDALAYHVAHAAEELRELGMKAQHLSIIARPSRHGDWLLRGGTKDVVLSFATNDTRVLLKEALRLWHELYEPGVPYKKAGVTLGMFKDAKLEQGDLFNTDDGSNDIMNTIDQLNRRFGSEAVTIGRMHEGGAWKASRAHVSPCYTTNWGEIREIKV